MTEERITLPLFGSKLVWNRTVKYENYDLINSKVLISAGNESYWMSYTEQKYFTSDFWVMVTSDNLLYEVSLLIRYGTEPAIKWACSGAPLWACSESSSGIFPTKESCELACRGTPCVPNWICETPSNGYENDGCGSRRANARCDPPPGTKWKCSGAPNYQCVQDPNGNYLTQAACQAACKAGTGKDNTIWIVAAALIVGYLFLMRKK